MRCCDQRSVQIFLNWRSTPRNQRTVSTSLLCQSWRLGTNSICKNFGAYSYHVPALHSMQTLALKKRKNLFLDKTLFKRIIQFRVIQLVYKLFRKKLMFSQQSVPAYEAQILIHKFFCPTISRYSLVFQNNLWYEISSSRLICPKICI